MDYLCRKDGSCLTGTKLPFPAHCGCRKCLHISGKRLIAVDVPTEQGPARILVVTDLGWGVKEGEDELARSALDQHVGLVPYLSKKVLRVLSVTGGLRIPPQVGQ